MRKASAVSMAVAMGMMGAVSMGGEELLSMPYRDGSRRHPMNYACGAFGGGKRHGSSTGPGRAKLRARNKVSRKSRIFNAQRARGVR